MGKKEKKDLSLPQKNMKYLRSVHGISQGQLGKSLGYSRPQIGSYEEGRASVSFELALEMAKYFGITADAIGTVDLAQMPEKTLEDLKQSPKRTDITGKQMRILTLTVNEAGRENIEFVPEKAAAGYISEHGNSAFLEELPRMHIPMLGNGTYRAFEIEGDSMLPIPSGSVVIGEYMQNWREIKEGEAYIIVSNKRGIVFKRIYEPRETKSSLALTLVSDNGKLYPPYEIELEPEDEIWKAKMVMSTDLSKPPVPTAIEMPDQPQTDLSLESLYPVIIKMQKEILELKDKRS